MRSVEDDYIPQEGEFLFIDHATVDQLNEAFPLYNGGVPIKTKTERLAELKDVYQPQLDLLKDNMLAAMGMDGTSQATKIQAISDQYKVVYAEYTAERKLIV